MKIEKLQTENLFPENWNHFDYFSYCRQKINEIIDSINDFHILLNRSNHLLGTRIRNLSEKVAKLEEKRDEQISSIEPKACKSCKRIPTITKIGIHNRFYVHCQRPGCVYTLRTGECETKEIAIQEWNRWV